MCAVLAGLIIRPTWGPKW